MQGWWADFTARLSVPGLALLAAVIALLCGLAIRYHLRGRITPEELEKRRRQLVNRNGKLGDGEIVDIEGATIFYSYYVAGVGYSTAQDARTLDAMLPRDRMMLLGPVSIKYLTTNPANSIVLSEGWSGLRRRDLSAAESA